uniref:Uncharacterized protein n=1 Tax=Vitis vinifera TaxID=29760 RepID=F6I5E2_VITVI
MTHDFTLLRIGWTSIRLDDRGSRLRECDEDEKLSQEEEKKEKMVVQSDEELVDPHLNRSRSSRDPTVTFQVLNAND